MKKQSHPKESLWKLSSENGIDFRFMNSHDGFKAFNSHWHDCMELIYVSEGSIHITLDDVKKTVSEGQLIIILPKQVHAGIPHADGVKIYSFFLDLESLTNKTYITSQFIKPLIDGDFVFANTTNHPKIINKLYEIINTPKKYHPVYIQGLYFELIGLLFEYAFISQKRSSTIKIKNILIYIQEHLSEEITPKNISEFFSYSESHLCRMFKNQMGVTVCKYVQNLRIENAKTLLLETNMEIRNISETCGFTDFSYFCRLFKASTNCSPSQFRKNYTQTKS